MAEEAPPSEAPAPARKPRRYPRPGRGPIRRWLPSWRVVLGSVVSLALLAIVGFVLAVLLIPVPQPNDIARAQVSTFYWDDGTTVLGRFGETNRTNVGLAAVADSAEQAVVAAEDRSFYDHTGFSPTGLARAFWNNIVGGDTQGGSTITQQYAKNAFLTQDKTYVRKFKELVLAVKLETTESKSEILNDYLNTVYYGRGAYGIEAASLAYFGVPATELTVAQSAMLAALLQAPSSLAPEKDPRGLEYRWNYVLDGMVANGNINNGERAALTFPEVLAYSPPTNYYQGTDGYLFAAAQQQMYQLGFTEDDLNLEGLQVVTTFNQETQAQAVAAVDDYGPSTGTDGLRIGLASVIPATGAVVAIYGGPDFQENQYNNATQARGQAGSTFKPFGLAAGLGNGIGLDTRYSGASPMDIQGYDIENYGNTSYGRVTMLYATEQSINTPYVQMNAKIGGDKTKQSLIAAGLPEDTPGLNDDITNVLGAASPTPLEVAGGYATLANRGVQTPTSMVSQVRSASGSVLYDLNPSSTMAYTQLVADRVTYALRQAVRSGTATTAQGVGRPVAAKTGTSDDNMSAWFAGYSPQLATVVMMVKNDAEGNNISLSGTGGLNTVTGGSFPARIWTAYMEAALEDTDWVDFEEPTSVYDSRSPSPVAPRTRSAAPSTTSASPSPTPSPSAETTSAVPTPTPTPTATPSASVTVTPQVQSSIPPPATASP